MEKLKNISEWEVLTPNGWSIFTGIKEKKVKEYLKLFYDNEYLECTIDHEIKLKNEKFVRADKLIIGDEILYKNNIIKIKEIIKISNDVFVYDLLNVEKNNEYYTNNIVSHNCGRGGVFYDNWEGAINSENTFNPIKLRWDLHPDRDQKWRDDMTKKFGERESSQEYDCSFLSSGSNVVGSKIIVWYEKTYIKPPISKRYNDNLWVWEEPILDDPDVKYTISCDVARGDGQDYSGMHIWKEYKNDLIEQVAEYKGRIPTSTFAKYIVSLALEYNNAFVIIENNSIGWATLQKVIEYYDNVFYSPKTSSTYSSNNMETVIEAFMDFDKLVPGFSTSKGTRDSLVFELEERLRLRKVIIHSARFILELNNWIWKSNGRAEHRDGKHDDLIMAGAIGLFVNTFMKKMVENGFNLYSHLIDVIVSNDGTDKLNDIDLLISTLSSKNQNINTTQTITLDDGTEIDEDISCFL